MRSYPDRVDAAACMIRARSLDWEPTMPFEPGRYQYLRGNVSWRNPSPADAPAPAEDAQVIPSTSRPSSSQTWREFAHLALSVAPLQASSDPDEALLAVAAAV